jgi:CheY-like chemotaxis protein
MTSVVSVKRWRSSCCDALTVTVAATVKEALEQIQAQEFDLLPCDLNIDRGGDGYKVIRGMREANPNCLNIVLTGYPEEESAEEGIQLGIGDYIAKPASALAHKGWKALLVIAILAWAICQRRFYAFFYVLWRGAAPQKNS